MRFIKPSLKVKRKRKVFFFWILAFCIEIFALWYFSKPALASWWDDNWIYRKAIPVTNNTTAETNVYISVTLDTSDSTKYQTDCGDLRFTKQNGELLPYYIASGCTTATTVVHVNLDVFPAGAQTFYVYYGSPTAGDGFNLSDFATQASNYTVGTIGTEEKGVGPISYWKFEEATGRIGHDSSGNNANATFSGVTGTTTPSYAVSAGTPNVGTGADGACNVTADTTLDTTTPSCSGRGTADAVNFSSTVNTAAAATSIKLTATSTGLAVGDEVLIINLQGASGNTANVGKYETKTISSITTTTNPNDTLNFATGLTNGYDGTTQKIMVQRVPNYTTVTVNSGQTMTATAWDGTKNGVLFFRASGTVTVSGSISMAGRGYRLGAKGLSFPTLSSGTQGESYGGAGTVSSAANLGAGGGGIRGNPLDGKNAGGGGGGGAYGAVGSNGLNGSRYCCSSGTDGFGATGGAVYGDSALAKLLLGSGGGGGGSSVNGSGGDGGAGGGIVSINATTLSITGSVSANGNNGSPGVQSDGAGGGGGGGSGGSIQITGTNLTLGTSFLTASAGSGGFLAPFCGAVDKFNNCIYTTVSGTGGAGGVGRIAIVATSTDTAPAWQPETQCVVGRCLLFNGTTTSGAVAKVISGIQTISFWIKPTIIASTSILDLDGGTHTITTNGSGVLSANGFTSPIYYINGKATTTPTLTVDTWQYVTVTTSVGFNSSASQTLGKISTAYFKGYLDEIKYYDFAKTVDQIKTDMQKAQSTHGSGEVLGNKIYDPLSSGLTGYWKMDETSGNAADSSGNGTTLTNNGTTTFAAGKFGNASFPSVNTMFFSTSTVLPNVQTVSFWINPTANTSSPIDLNGTQTITATSGTISANNFTSPAIYVNGVVSTTLTAGVWQLVTVTTNTAFNTGSMTIGKVSTNSLNGYIDEVRIYNRALSPKEVSDLYNFAPGPVGYWNFEEGSGTSANDTSGNEYTGTWIGTGSHWTNGKYGVAGNFNGSSDYVDAGDATNLKITGTITTEAWIKTPSPATNSQMIVTKSSVADNGYEFRFNSTTGKLQVIFGGTTPTNLIGNTVLAANTWYHVAATYDGATAKIYLNGALDNSVAMTGSITSNTEHFLIGARYESGTPAFFYSGQIDEAKIYNYARSPSQVVSDMNAGHPAIGSPVGSSLVYWKFDEGADNRCSAGVNDVCNSGTGGTVIDGAESNMSVPATTTSGWTNSGKFNKALIFDGTDDIVNAGTDASIDNLTAGPMTLSAWIYPNTLGENSRGVIMAKNNGATLNAGWLWQLTATNTLKFSVDGSTDLVVTAANSKITMGAWNHVLLSWDGIFTTASSVHMYVNGKEVTYQTQTNGATIVADGASSLFIGNDSSGASTFDGIIDEAKIYKYALTADDVKEEYNRGQSLQLGAAGNSSTYQIQAANQEYCVPGDTTACTPPVGRWDFEEGKGTNAFDTSGSGAVGTITGATYTNGKVGKALNFNNSTDAVAVSSSLSTKTIEFWVNPSSTTQDLIDLRTAATAASVSVSSGSLTATGFTSPTYYINGYLTASPTLVANQWQHVAITTGTAITANAIRFGRISTSLTGKLDSIRIFDYARSASQIAYDFNRGAPVGYWKLDECQGATAYDSAFNQNNGTITIGALGENTIGTCNTSSTSWGSGATGKRNSSLSLDGSDDYINVGDPANGSLDFGTAAGMSVSAWIKTTSNSAMMIAAKDDNVLGRSYAFYITSNKLGFFNGLDVFELGRTNVTTGDWKHVVATYQYVTNGTSKVRMYVNGVLDYSSDTASGPIPDSSALFQIGGRTYSGAEQYFNGQMDDVKIFNYPITATQVKDLYNGGAVNYSPATGAAF